MAIGGPFLTIRKFSKDPLQIDDLIRTLRKTRPAPGTAGPLIPGDPEREAEAIRRREGIPLVMPVVDELRDISRQTGIPL